jgi:proteasome lid subunit RPN8/RPN11
LLQKSEQEPNRNRLRHSVQEQANPVSMIHVWNSPWTDQGSFSLQIVSLYSVYEAILNHVAAALPGETGGFLLGDVGYDSIEDRWHLYITDIMSISPVESDMVHFVFSWRDVEMVRERRKKLNKAIIGWYHSHPNMGVFLSQTDLERTHFCLFNEPFQIALVVDPVRNLAGYFCRQNPEIMDPSEQQWREFSLTSCDKENAVLDTASPESVTESHEPSLLQLRGQLSAVVARNLHAIPMRISWECMQCDEGAIPWEAVRDALFLVREDLSGRALCELGRPQMIHPGVFEWEDIIPADLVTVRWRINTFPSSQINLTGLETDRELLWSSETAERA